MRGVAKDYKEGFAPGPARGLQRSVRPAAGRRLLCEGRGVETDCKRGVDLIEKAAQGGLPEGQTEGADDWKTVRGRRKT